MTEHTPLPWQEDTILGGTIYAHNVPKGPMRIADIRGWGYLTGKGYGALGLPHEEAAAIQAANAALIVKAVNSHEALVEGLRNCVRAYELQDACNFTQQMRDACEAAAKLLVGLALTQADRTPIEKTEGGA